MRANQSDSERDYKVLKDALELYAADVVGPERQIARRLADQASWLIHCRDQVEADEPPFEPDDDADDGRSTRHYPGIGDEREDVFFP